MRNWNATDFIAVLLTITICVTFIATALTPAFLGIPITDARSNSLSGIAGAIVTLITIYIKDRLKGDD